MSPAQPWTLRDLGRSLNPPEIGGWFMIGFPLLAALLLHPSGPGAALAGAGFTAFLLRVPLKQVRSGVRPALSRALLGTGALLIAACTWTAAGLGPWKAFLPLLGALPCAAVALRADLRKRARDLGVELAVLAFFCAFAPAIAIAGGASAPAAAGLWAQLFLSLAPGFAAVRYQLHARREPQGPERIQRWRTMHAVMVACLILGALLLLGRRAGPGWWLLQVLLYGRAFVPLHRGPAWNLGVLEILADGASVALIVLGR